MEGHSGEQVDHKETGSPPLPSVNTVPAASSVWSAVWGWRQAQSSETFLITVANKPGVLSIHGVL